MFLRSVIVPYLSILTGKHRDKPLIKAIKPTATHFFEGIQNPSDAQRQNQNF